MLRCFSPDLNWWDSSSGDHKYYNSRVGNWIPGPSISSLIFTLRSFSRRFCPKQLTVIHTYILTLMAVVAMQGADWHIRSSFGVQSLAQGHFDMQTRGIEPVTWATATRSNVNGPQTCMTIHLIVVEMPQCGPKWWTNPQTNITLLLVWLKTKRWISLSSVKTKCPNKIIQIKCALAISGSAGVQWL